MYKAGVLKHFTVRDSLTSKTNSHSSSVQIYFTNKLFRNMYNNIFEPERFFKMILLNYISNKIDNDNGAIMVLMVILV